MLDDTICAIASAPGPAARGLLRISGPDAFATLTGLLVAHEQRVAPTARRAPPAPPRRAAFEAAIDVLGYAVPALVLTMPGPGSFTGEDVVELHLPGSPLLLTTVAATAASLGARAALPGEFTRRAFRNGRMGRDDVESLLLLLHAANDAERRTAFAWRAGGLTAAVAAWRDRLLDVGALLESGLDFTSDETGAVDREMWAPTIDDLATRMQAWLAALPAIRDGGALLLVGPASAGKSSLCNALAGRTVALVDAAPGTTRDVLAVDVGDGIVLLDGPGDRSGAFADADDERVDAQARASRDRLGTRAAGRLLVVDARHRQPITVDGDVLAVVRTHGDRCDGRPVPLTPASIGRDVPEFVVSNPTGDGLPALRAFLAQRGNAGARAVLEPVRAAIAAAFDPLRRSLDAPADEIAAMELREARAALDAVVDVAHDADPEAILDRIFARFCLGK